MRRVGGARRAAHHAREHLAHAGERERAVVARRELRARVLQLRLRVVALEGQDDRRDVFEAHEAGAVVEGGEDEAAGLEGLVHGAREAARCAGARSESEKSS